MDQEDHTASHQRRSPEQAQQQTRRAQHGVLLSPWACYQCKSQMVCASLSAIPYQSTEIYASGVLLATGRLLRVGYASAICKAAIIHPLRRDQAQNWGAIESEESQIPNSTPQIESLAPAAYQDDGESGRKVSPSPEIRFLHTAPEVMRQNNTAHICHLLGLEQSHLSRLTNLYFFHITSISLFHRPTFERRVYVELMPEQASTLLASMFCLAVRYAHPGVSSGLDGYDGTGAPRPERFYELASDASHRHLRSCGDKPPPLFLLQALVLTTYNELVIGVRGVAWRSLGLVIRIAYEMGLHLVDLPSRSTRQDGSESVEVWVAKEERRRVWWTIWELEVFATTIRRSPIGMDQSQHATLLPVEDTFWFEGKKAPSCFLDADPTLRWKNLQKSGNENGRAWFIVVNSFMRDAHSLANPSVPQDVTFGRGQPLGTQRPSDSADIGPQLVVLENCVSCFSMALPKKLQYRLDLSSSNEATSRDLRTRKRNSDRQSIHVMTQLAKLMILHNGCFRDDGSGASSQTEDTDHASSSSMRGARRPLDVPATHPNALSRRYLHAAEQVVSTVRNSAPNHITDGHPLLANTVWMVAAIQIVRATFAETKSERLVAQSNLDLLRLNLIQHRDFWNTSSVLVQNLDNLEDAMEKTHAHAISLGANRSAPRTHPSSPDEERVPYRSDITFTQNMNSPREPLAQGQDVLGEPRGVEIGPNSEVVPFDGGIQPCNTALDDDSSIGLSMDLSMEAIISGVWETSNDLFYNSDILANLNNFS
ncbi:fungal specific transcription factor, putative [Paecilomyces variotii No. 5]|uniref:Fungal specific transcription factor, putative n=1 Tax=Byssochlamys spectabilis (strain No. 5 / NBRC 109023) TaxID=1356009 RepID=V5G446_BYSSN|nr:fungal specific transcription factor, putative [Paecilomyces variotii No. 5]